jgi:pyridoxamine---pyruvate transaminase
MATPQRHRRWDLRMSYPDFTLTTGPAMASPRVLSALGEPIVYHYDPSFVAEFRAMQEKVQRILQTGYDAVMMQGEAVLGLEAATRSLVQPGTPVLNLVSGVFGAEMGNWLRAMGGKVSEIVVPNNESVDPAAVEEHLSAHGEIELLTVVHSETPSGTCNDVEAIGKIAQRHGVLTLADCASSLVAQDLRPDEWGLDICVASPQKALAGPAGSCIVSVSPAAWQKMEANPAAPRSSFLSLLDWKHKWLERGAFPYAPSAPDVRGLSAACDEVLQDGLAASFELHALASASCRAGVRAMGLELWPASGAIVSPSVTAIKLPDTVSDGQLCEHVRAKYGVMLSGGAGAGNIARIGHLGPTARSFYPAVGLLALGRGLIDLGVDVNLGSGLEAATDVLAGS